MSDDDLRVLAVFNRPGPIRLAEVVAALNPRPRSKRARWFGGPALDRWCERNAVFFATVKSLADAGLLRQVHRGRTPVGRRDEYRDRYAITEAGWYTLTGTQFAEVEEPRSQAVTWPE